MKRVQVCLLSCIVKIVSPSGENIRLICLFLILKDLGTLNTRFSRYTEHFHYPKSLLCSACSSCRPCLQALETPDSSTVTIVWIFPECRVNQNQTVCRILDGRLSLDHVNFTFLPLFRDFFRDISLQHWITSHSWIYPRSLIHLPVEGHLAAQF